jgi:hypothetical protein
MRIDKEKLRQMLSRDDESLWCEIRRIAKSHGFDLPEKAPPKSEMDKLRSTVGDGSRLNLGDAAKIINNYKRGMKK